MNSFEFNKIAGALLGTALAIFGLGELGRIVYHTETPEKPGMIIETAQADDTGGAAAAAQSLGTLLAAASVEKGAASAKACAACHDFTKGGPNKVGPNLYDVVDRGVGGVAGFAYSEAVAAKKADKWTFDNLDAWLKDPKAHIPGTKMAFGGIKSDAKRADVLAYLASLSDAPKPFPAP
jgi:cytochrome c